MSELNRERQKPDKKNIGVFDEINRIIQRCDYGTKLKNSTALSRAEVKRKFEEADFIRVYQ